MEKGKPLVVIVLRVKPAIPRILQLQLKLHVAKDSTHLLANKLVSSAQQATNVLQQVSLLQ